MTDFTKKELCELLTTDYSEFSGEYFPKAKAAFIAARGDRLVPVAMLGFTNICRNACLYCGMRAAHKIPRYRLPPEDVIAAGQAAKREGYKRLFLIAGEDPGYGFDKLLRIVNELKNTGLYISLACGELEKAQYAELRDAGASEYVMKFEMSDPATFNRLNPSTTFERRMAGIEAVKAAGLALGSGDIVGVPGQSIGQLADDILLMRSLGISWAPVVPYLPVAGTPLAEEGPRGDYHLNLRVIALLRLMMPKIDITAQQPGEDVTHGFADERGNLLALSAGANMLFGDLLPAALAKNFSVVDNREVFGMEHIKDMAARAGMEI